jgi:RNA polymerase sigma-32 factor
MNNKNAFLSKSDEYNLVSNVQERNCKLSLTRLVTSHEFFVKKMANRFKGFQVDVEDLYQEGYIGLIKAISAFDAEKGFRLNTFAAKHIKSELSNFVISNYKMSKVATTKEHRKLFFNLRSMMKTPGVLSLSEASDIAQKLNIDKVQTVMDMHGRLHNPDVFIAQTSYSENTLSIGEDRLSDTSSDFASVYLENTADEYNKELFNQAVLSLNNKQAFVISQRWMNEKKISLKEMALLMSCSPEQVRLIEVKALNILKVAVTKH